jgi:heme-degrading monooxygenase HmoA
MTFQPDARELFLTIFNANKEFIAGSEGCSSLQLLNEKSNPHVFFTISVWDSEDHLNMYRESKLFGEVWGKTKVLFSGKPEAWTLVSGFQFPVSS